MATVLVADDDVDALEATRMALVTAGHNVIAHGSGREVLLTLTRTDVDIVLTDYLMPDMTGIELCRHIVGNRPDIPVVLMTGAGTLEIAVTAMRAGAYDFLVKPVTLGAVLHAIDRAVRHRALLQKISLLRIGGPTDAGFEDILGSSPAMSQVFDIIQRVADTEASVLIGGASGTGKELIARALHRHSRRRAGPFVSINCAALPEALLESELFGHARGAFTDAKQAHGGLFAEARGGTFFLDEIGDMPLALQPKLLRALQERTVRPVGSATEIPIDVRIIAATNHDLETAVEEGRFRSDLFFRVNVVSIALPPLRSRGNDTLLLAQHFLQRFAHRENKAIRGLAPAAAEKLLAYDWPGNVRELQNCMERAVALGRYEEIGPEDLPEKIRDFSPTTLTLSINDPDGLLSLQEVERRYIARVLAAFDGNKTTAARVLGIDRKTLYAKLRLAGNEPSARTALKTSA